MIGIADFLYHLFRLVTSAGWNDVLEPLLVTPPGCDPHYKVDRGWTSRMIYDSNSDSDSPRSLMKNES